ncbi:T6SS effector phospholipase Tle3 domain-containing protein [Thiosocius teredinicola]|uniref:T6SS effector phospholipase Tle3 domain-containing protein n=1 Tax=Thiosocius teredinicola TaxID=1973002 RepID=UPI0009911FF7
MSKERYSPNKRVRDAGKNGDVIKEFVTTPKVGETDQVDIRFKRPMPGIIILVHGVNDVGEAYPTQADGLCQGLNIRLGRDDLTPGEWDVPRACKDNRVVSHERRAEAQGYNPIIPFYWGFRAVDKATYDADQARYRDELRRRRDVKEVDAPYDAYYVVGANDPSKGYENQDCFGNRLDENFAKNGGVFANATSNLVDMWGPGGNIWGIVKWISRYVMDDLSHPMYENPHRVYFVWAAQRLADLIAEIRNRPNTKDDSITLVAHSQGTMVSMLANFLAANSPDSPSRPADCLILNNSPYSFQTPFHEASQSFGPQQSKRARIETFANLCQLTFEQRVAGPSAEHLVAKGVAASSVKEKEAHMRDNHGRIFNYFCPHDMTVSLDNVEGFGWQGVPLDIHEKCGEGFGQRMFLDNEFMHLQPSPKPRKLPNLKRALAKVFSNEDVPTGALRDLNAGMLPDLDYEFTLLSGCNNIGSSNWGVQAAATPETGRNIQREVVRNPFERLPDRLTYTSSMLNAEEIEELEAALRNQGKDWQLASASLSSDRKWFVVDRYLSRQELYADASSTPTEDSHHSAIVLNRGASKCVTAFDVAVGRCNSYDFTKKDGGEFWQNLLRMADWRESGAPDDVKYWSSGLLPERIKRQMNKPLAVAGIVNEIVEVSDYEKIVKNLDTRIRRLHDEKSNWPTREWEQRVSELERNRRNAERARKALASKHQYFPIVHTP